VTSSAGRVDDVEVLTAAQAEVRQRRLAGSLLAAGLVAGDRVALATTSGPAMLCAVMGALRVGIVPVLLNAGLLEAERVALLEDARPTLVVDDPALAALEEGPPTELAAVPLARPMHYTSGTTGTPKGVWSGVLAEGDALRLFQEEADLWGFEPGDVHLVCGPLHHSAPVRFSAATLLRGGSVAFAGKFDAARIAGAIEATSPTTTFVAPTHLQRLFELGELPSLASFRLVAHAGAPCPTTVKERAIHAFPAGSVWEFYGSTEGQFTACSSQEWLDRPGTVGRARPGRQLAVDPDGTIWCATPPYARFAYWRDPERTRAAWREGAGGHAAFTVGDLGRLDDDGYLWLDGRRHDLIISGGVNVYPAEVEAVLARLAGVRDVAVVGVDDERWGQRVCAAVVGEVSAEAVHAFADEHLAPYKRPKEVVVVVELPYTSTGKLQRSRVAGAVGLEPPT
jgi:long-chain acyl-CoA synthetase